MSWQRILETARKRGIPVIVTDIAGREPMVILPFAEFERMGEGAKNQEARSKKQEEVEAFADFEVEELQKQVDAAMSDLAKDSMSDAGLSLEEKFYLEPVDEDQK